MAKKIIDTGKPARRIEPEVFASSLGAEPIGQAHSQGLDALSLVSLGNDLLARLRSSGGRPALADATEICRVPLSADDVKRLEAIVEQLEGTSGTKPSVGQLVSVIVRTHLTALNGVASAAPKEQKNQLDSTALLQNMIDEQLLPLRQRVKRLERELKE